MKLTIEAPDFGITGDINAEVGGGALGSERAAWFRDPEGNILCLHEDLA